MATLRSVIELYDHFSTPLMNVVQAVDMGVSAMADFQATMNEPVSAAIAENVTQQMNEAVQAIEAAQAALNDTVINHENSTVNWVNPTTEVFTDSGAERFQQEVQSANAMLEKLNSTQQEIAAQAERVQLFPSSMVNDMNTMQSRIQGIQAQIQNIENNPLNMGTDQANSELEMLRNQLNNAVQIQNEMNVAIQNMDITTANSAYIRLSQTVGNTERYIRDNVDEQGRFNQEINEGVSNADNLMDAIKGFVAAYATVQTVGNVIELSDTVTQTTARLDLIVDDGGSVEELQNKIYASAQNARGSYLTTADAITKLGTQASQAFSSNDELIAFTELLNKQFVNAGTATQGIDAAMLQLTQSMAAGRLQGDELTSILENATPIVQNIQRYLEEVQNIDASNIKELAAEGIITADVIKNSMFYAADEINTKFESMPMTFGQMWQSFQNSALMAFQPVLQRINDLANNEGFNMLVENAVSALATVANIVLSIFEGISAVASFAYENWSIIEPIIMGIVAALGLYYGAMLLYNTVTGISTAITAAKAFAEQVHAAALAMQTGATFAATAAQYGFNAALLACPITWIIILIIALIAVFYAVIGAINKFAGTSISATGVIGGVFATLGAHILNTFVVPAWNGFASLANFFGNVFNNPVGAVKVLFYDMCLTVIGYIANLAHAIENLINKIPGVTVDITSGLDNFYSGLEQAQQAVKDETGWVEYVGKMDYIDYGDAFEKGYSVGEGIESAVDNFSISDMFGSTNIPNPDDYAYALDNSGVGTGIGDIAGNTGSIADSMEISEEELKYLRDIAEQEAINRFTTAEIYIDQSGMQNTIKNGDDIDGFMTKLTDSVNEAVDTMAEGVHD